jgi:hypothetical protein
LSGQPDWRDPSTRLSSNTDRLGPRHAGFRSRPEPSISRLAPKAIAEWTSPSPDWSASDLAE